MSEPDDDTTTPTHSRARRILKWGGGLLGGVAVLVLVAALVLPRLFTSEQLKGYVIPPLEEATGRQVEIDAIGLRVLPAPAIRVSGVRLANAEGYGPAPAVQARELNVDVALWPLFVAKIRPTAVGLVDPTIRYEVAEDGTTNFDTLGGETDTTEAEGSPLGGIPLSDVRVSGAKVHYTDRRTGQGFRLEGDVQLGVVPEGTALTSNGTVDLQLVRALLPSVGPDTLTVQNAQAIYDVHVAPSAGRVDLRTLRIETAPITLTMEGELSDLNEQPRIDLAFETGSTDLAEIETFVPAAAVEGLNPQGTLDLEGTVSGPLSGEADTAKTLSVTATGQLADGGIDYDGKALLRNLSANLQLADTSVTAQGIDGQLVGNSLSGRVTVRDPMSNPQVDGQLAGTAELAPLLALARDGSGAESVRGRADFDVGFIGPLDIPNSIRPDGHVHLIDMQVPYESFRHPIKIPDATVQLTGTGLSMDRFTVRSGSQTAALKTTMQNLFPISKGLAETNPALSATITLTSDRLDLVTLYPEADTSEATYSQLFAAHLAGSTVNGEPPEALAEKRYGGLELPTYAVEGRVEIGTLLNEPQRFDDLSFDVQMDDRRLAVRNLTASTYGGTLAGTMTLDQSGRTGSATAPTEGSMWLAAADARRVPAAGAAPQSDLAFDVELQEAKAGGVLTDWTLLGQFVTGTLTLNADGKTALTNGLLPETTTFTATGQSIVTDGGLALDLGPTGALADALNLPTGSLEKFERLGGPFAVRDGQFQLKTWSFGGSQFDGTVQGALGLGGSMDLEMTLDLPLEVVQKSNIVSRLDGDDGQLSTVLGKLLESPASGETVSVTLRFGGTMRDPTVQVVNRDAVTSRIESLAEDAGLDLLRDLFGGSGGG